MCCSWGYNSSTRQLERSAVWAYKLAAAILVGPVAVTVLADPEAVKEPPVIDKGRRGSSWRQQHDRRDRQPVVAGGVMLLTDMPVAGLDGHSQWAGLD